MLRLESRSVETSASRAASSLNRQTICQGETIALDVARAGLVPCTRSRYGVLLVKVWGGRDYIIASRSSAGL